MANLVPMMLGLALVVAGTAPPASDGCSCEQAAETNGWCDVHDVGYVGHVRIESARLFEALDAHGHDVDPGTFRCGACREAIASDGFCAQHRVGFVARQAYFSRLSHGLAKGHRKRVSQIACPICKKNASTHGWCDDCNVGMVGSVEIGSRQEYDRLSAALEALHAANEAAKRCERCAVAIVTDTRCHVCKISYRDGKAVPEDSD